MRYDVVLDELSESNGVKIWTHGAYCVGLSSVDQCLVEEFGLFVGAEGLEIVYNTYVVYVAPAARDELELRPTFAVAALDARLLHLLEAQ